MRTIQWVFVLTLLLPPVMIFGQDDADIIGLGGGAGMSITSRQLIVGSTFQISAFREGPMEHVHRYIRLKGDVGTWSAESMVGESYGTEETRWRLFHLSMSAHVLMGSDVLLWSVGLGTAFFLIHETETVRYTFGKEAIDPDDELKTSYISFGLFPEVGMIIPLNLTTEIGIHFRYDFVMHPVRASRLAILTGFYMYLN
jgi:hypothetical protein